MLDCKRLELCTLQRAEEQAFFTKQDFVEVDSALLRLSELEPRP